MVTLLERSLGTDLISISLRGRGHPSTAEHKLQCFGGSAKLVLNPYGVLGSIELNSEPSRLRRLDCFTPFTRPPGAHCETALESSCPIGVSFGTQERLAVTAGPLNASRQDPPAQDHLLLLLGTPHLFCCLLTNKEPTRHCLSPSFHARHHLDLA